MPTNNHDYDTPAKFSPNWHIPLNSNFSNIDLDVPFVDIEANRPSIPPTDFQFVSTDNRTLSVYSGESSGYKTIAGRGTEETPLSVGPYTRGLMQKQSIEAGETLTIPEDFGALISDEYHIEGELAIEGTVKVI